MSIRLSLRGAILLMTLTSVAGAQAPR